jgi:hypothetical protein
MNYDTAKKLKEAGFPQTGSVIVSPMVRGYPAKPPYDVTYPTLSELIEACKMFTLRLSIEQHSNDWRAGIYAEKDKGTFCCGSTPEEAVASLWLALNKK